MSISIEYQERIVDLVEDNSVTDVTILAQAIGIDYRALSYSLKYGMVPSSRTLIIIADYFNVSMEYLLGKSDDSFFEKSKEKNSFWDRLELLCKERQSNYCKESKACHFDKNYISRWIKNKYIASLDMLEILADHFEVSLDYLLGRTDYRK